MQNNSTKTDDIDPQKKEFSDLFYSATPRAQAAIKALLALCANRTPQGPLTSTQREQNIAIVLPYLEKLRADGFAAEDAENLLSEIMEGGKS